MDFDSAPDELKFDLIRSGQVPGERIARLFREQPEFQAYYETRLREIDEATRAVREGGAA